MTAMWTKTMKTKDIDGTTLKDEKETVEAEHVEEGDSSNEGGTADDSEDDSNCEPGGSGGTSEDEYSTDED